MPIYLWLKNLPRECNTKLFDQKFQKDKSRDTVRAGYRFSLLFSRMDTAKLLFFHHGSILINHYSLLNFQICLLLNGYFAKYKNSGWLLLSLINHLIATFLSSGLKLLRSINPKDSIANPKVIFVVYFFNFFYQFYILMFFTTFSLNCK